MKGFAGLKGARLEQIPFISVHPCSSVVAFIFLCHPTRGLVIAVTWF